MSGDSVEIKIDYALHPSTPSPAQERTWALLDTALNLLRLAAAELVVENLRESHTKAGVPYPETSEGVHEMMVKNAALLGRKAPVDLAHIVNPLPEVVEAISLAFKTLAADSFLSAGKAIDEMVFQQVIKGLEL